MSDKLKKKKSVYQSSYNNKYTSTFLQDHGKMTYLASYFDHLPLVLDCFGEKLLTLEVLFIISPMSLKINNVLSYSVKRSKKQIYIFFLYYDKAHLVNSKTILNKSSLIINMATKEKLFISIIRNTSDLNNHNNKYTYKEWSKN